MKRKIIAWVMAMTLICTSTIGVFADNGESTPNVKDSKVETAKVYEIDSYGNITESSIPLSFYLELSKNGKASLPSDQGTITPSIVPLPDPGAVKITPSYFTSFNLSNYTTQVNYVINLVFIAAYTQLGLKLVKLGVGGSIGETAWKSVWLQAAYSTAYASVATYVTNITTYSESYQYTVWSDYYQMYAVHNVLIAYSDSAHNYPQQVDDWVGYYSTYLAGSTSAQ